MATLEELLQAINPVNTYQRYIGQPFANVAGPFGRGFLGLQRPEYGSEEAYRTGQAVSNMPAVGIPAGAMKAAAQVPGLLADVVQAAKGSDELAGLLALTAYHGSPHRFSKFDASKIGTGEGAQAYGHGLYFAESPGVAREYQNNLARLDPTMTVTFQGQISDKAKTFAENALKKHFGDASAASIDLLDGMRHMSGSGKSVAQEAIDALKKVKVSWDKDYPIGHFYTVDIPDEMVGKMLDWDVSISKQPESVKSFLIPLAKKYGVASTADAGSLLQWMQTGPSRVAPSQLSEMLREAGIPGIRYLDQGSRGAGTGTRNFVVFPGEEEAIRMLSVE